MTFNPVGNEEVFLGGYTFRIRALAESGPLARKALRMVGGRAQVYQLIETGIGQPHALKVMLPAFRKPQLVRNQRLLAQLMGKPGFEACNLTYLIPQTHPEELALCPDLIYSSLMPWVQGGDWTTIISNPASTVDPESSWEIAYQLVRLVSLLERNNIAHCDLSGGNVMVNLKERKVTLIDFDEVFWESAPAPAEIPMGTPGYRRGLGSQWEIAGDRFATAVLVGEMLGWRDERVRSRSSGDSYFTDEDCLKQETDKFKLLEEFLHDLHATLGTLFRRAWQAQSSKDRPTVDEWRLAILEGRGWVNIPPDPLDSVNINMGAIRDIARPPTPPPLPPLPPIPPRAQPAQPLPFQPSSPQSQARMPQVIQTPQPTYTQVSNAAGVGYTVNWPPSGASPSHAVRWPPTETIAPIANSTAKRPRKLKLDLTSMLAISIVALTIGVLLVGMIFLLLVGRH